MALVTSFYPLYAALKDELLPGRGVARPSSSSASIRSGHARLAGRGPAAGRPRARAAGCSTWTTSSGSWCARTGCRATPLLLVGGAAAIARQPAARPARPARAGRRPAGPAAAATTWRAAGSCSTSTSWPPSPSSASTWPSLVAPLLRAPAAALPAGPWSASPPSAARAATGRRARCAPLYTAPPGQAQREAIPWVKRQHLPAESRIVIYDDALGRPARAGAGRAGLPRRPQPLEGRARPGHPQRRLPGRLAHGGLPPDDARHAAGLPRTRATPSPIEALRNASLVRRWEADGDVDRAVEGEPPRRDRGRPCSPPARRHITARFERDGALVRPDGTVASESQAYAMLRAVWSDDRAAFDRTWGWTRAQPAQQQGAALLAVAGRRGGRRHAAADADTDAALALLMAGQRWNDPALVEAGQRLVRAIWEHEVVTVAGAPTSPPGTGPTEGPVVALNPSYFSPYAYRVFKEVDPEHDWWAVIDTGYDVLFAASRAPLGAERSAGLPPGLGGPRPGHGRASCPCSCERGDTTRYGFDAARDRTGGWPSTCAGPATAGPRAYLSQAGFLRDEVQRKGEVSAVYARDGTIVERAPSVVGQAGALAALLTLDPPAGPPPVRRPLRRPAPSTPPGRPRTAPADSAARPSGATRTTCTPRTGAGSPPPSTPTPCPTSGTSRPAGHGAPGATMQRPDGHERSPSSGSSTRRRSTRSTRPARGPPAAAQERRRRGWPPVAVQLVALAIMGAGLGRGVDAMRQAPARAATPTAQAARPPPAPGARQGWLPALRSLTTLALEQADAIATAAARPGPSPVAPFGHSRPRNANPHATGDPAAPYGHRPDPHPRPPTARRPAPGAVRRLPPRRPAAPPEAVEAAPSRLTSRRPAAEPQVEPQPASGPAPGGEEMAVLSQAVQAAAATAAPTTVHGDAERPGHSSRSGGGTGRRASQGRARASGAGGAGGGRAGARAGREPRPGHSGGRSGRRSGRERRRGQRAGGRRRRQRRQRRRRGAAPREAAERAARAPGAPGAPGARSEPRRPRPLTPRPAPTRTATAAPPRATATVQGAAQPGATAKPKATATVPRSDSRGDSGQGKGSGKGGGKGGDDDDDDDDD